MDLLTLARCVKQGVKLLDRKIPNWRQIMRKHVTQYDFKDRDHCVLGTLEHFSGKLKTLKRRQGLPNYHSFSHARTALGIGLGECKVFGFDGSTNEGTYDQDAVVLGQLWRTEFEKA